MVTNGSTDDPVEFGVVGLGARGLIHAGQIADDPRSSVVAAADVSEAARTSAADDLGLLASAIYESIDELLDVETLDAVFIATPHTLHYEQITAALDRGLHVLCEKPLTTDIDHAKELVERAAESNRLVMPGYQRHLDPAFVAARERWQARESTPTMFTAEISQNWYSRFDGSWRANPDLSGGGMLYDTGSHVLDVMLWVTGMEPTAVVADMAFADEDHRVDKSASLLVEFAEGVTASVSIGGDAGGVREHYHLWDAEGGLFIEGSGWDQRTLSTVEGEEKHAIEFDDDSPNKVEAFLDSVVDGADLPATPRDALQTTIVTEAAYESARTGERVEIDIEN